MSVELLVCSQSPDPLTPGQLREDAAATGWELTFVDHFESLAPVQTLGGCSVLGFQTDTPNAARLRKAVRSHDRGRLQAAYEQDTLAMVELALSTPEPPTSAHVARWRAAGVAEALLERLKTARTCYALRTSANRNAISEEFQHQLWLLIGVLTEGLCVDEAEGRIIDGAEEP